MQEMRAAKRAAREAAEPVAVGCFLCGSAPQLGFQPCGHVVSCGACWEEAREAGVMSCYICKALVTYARKVAFR